MTHATEKEFGSLDAASRPDERIARLERQIEALDRSYGEKIERLDAHLIRLKRELSDIKSVIINKYEDRSAIVLRLNEISARLPDHRHGGLRGTRRAVFGAVSRLMRNLVRARKG